MSHRQENFGTLLGIFAIMLWGSLIAVYRGLTSDLGVFTSAAWIFTLGGGLGLLYIAVVQRKFRQLFHIAPLHFLGECLFVLINIRQ